MDAIFVDPVTLPRTGGGDFQLFFLAAVYGYILFKASGLIANGSEMLMLVFNPGLIGGLLLPVLGAVPDAAIVLFSGTAGDKTLAQQQLSVGVGTLAGSTIMLLTIPWAVCILLGRVDLSADGKTALYSKRPAKLTKGWSLTRTGVQAAADVPANAWIMMGTALTYIVVQGPAWAKNMTAARSASLAALIISAICFIGYSLYQVWSARSLEAQQRRQVRARTNALASRMIDIATLTGLESEATPASGNAASAGETAATKSKVSTVALRRVFSQYDVDGNGSVSPPTANASSVCALACLQLAHRTHARHLSGYVHACSCPRLRCAPCSVKWAASSATRSWTS